MGKMKRLLALLLMLAVMAGSVPALSEEAPATEPVIEEVVIEETPAPAEEIVIEETVPEEPEIPEESIAPEVTEEPELIEEVVSEPPVEPEVEPVLLAEVEPLNPPMIVFGEDWFHGDDGAVVIPCEAGDSSFEVEWTFDGSAELYRIQTAMVPEKGEDEVRRDVCSVTERSVELPTAAYLDGTYMLYLTAALPDGMVVSNQLRFRLQLPQKIVLNAEEIVLGVGESFALEALTNYGGAAECSFESSKPKYAAVSADGVVTAKKAGKAVITASFGELTAECRVTILRAPSSVTVSQKKLTLSAGQSAQLTAEVNKNSAGAISWSSNSEIASVDENGFVTAHATGTAKITATSYNGKKAVCTLTIVPAPSFVELDKAEISLPMGMSAQLKARSDAGSNPGFTYHSSDENIAVVDAEGKITAVSTGVAKIVVSTYNGFTAECAVTVTPAPTVVTLNAEEIVLGVGEKFQIEAAVDQGDEAGFTYASKNARTSTVDKTGLIVAKKAGTTIIRVTAFNGVYADCAVTVKKAPSSVKFADSKIELSVGQTAELEVVLSSGSAGEYSLSSDSECVRVNADGSITALASGTAKIMVKTYNGKKATCTVNIVGLPTYLNLEVSEFNLPMGMTGQIVPQIDPGSAASFGFVSSDESSAAVDESGKITAVSTGAAIITVSTHNGLTAECVVNVTPAPTLVTLNAENIELGVGEKYQIIASADQGDDAGFTYASKTARVATVNESGVITAKKAGTTVIRVTAFNGVYADCEVTVKKAPSKVSLSAKAITMFAGQEQPLAWKLNSGSAGGVSFSTSDENVAMADANGVIYAIAAGTAKITATTYNGKKATCTVTVQDPSNTITALRPEDGKVIATVSTIQECTILVEVLDEDSEATIMRASAPVDADLQMEEIAVSLPDALPRYYILRAVLQDEDGEDLCSAYITRKYTAAYASFENQTPSDFPSDKVLDLGSAGYAVYSSTTYPVTSNVTQSGGKYTFTPPAKLQPGYVVIIDGEPVKIDTVVYNPEGTVTITEDSDIYLSDIYDALHLDETITLRPNQSRMLRSSQGGVDLVEFASNFSFGPVEIEAKVSMSVTVRAFYDKKFFGADYFEYEIYTDAQGSLSTTLSHGVDTADEDYNKLSLVLYDGYIPVSIPGMKMSLAVKIPVDLKAEASGKAEVGFEVRSGYKYNPEGKAQPIQSKEIEAEVSFEGEFEMKIGPKMELSLDIVCLKGKVTAHAGVLARGELKGVSTQKEGAADGSYYHACDACVDMKIAAFAEFKGALEYKITEFLKGNLAELKLFSGEWEIGDAFLSVVNDRESIYGGKMHFDWGDCQNRRYRVRVSTEDIDGNTVTGKPVSITGSKTEKLSGESRMEAYLYPGDYTATVNFDKSTVKAPFTMPEAALDVTVSESAVSVSGHVTDGSTGKAISGAAVKITLPSGETRSLTTDSEGYYSIDSLPAGAYSFSFSAENYQPKENVTASYAAGTENVCDAALDPELPDKSGSPFISTQAWVSGDEVKMGGVGYSDAVVFQMGYTGSSSTGGIAEAVYNFQGKYSSMSFDAGFVEGSWKRDAEMTITADGRVIYDKVKLKYENVARRYTISLVGVQQLIIHFESHGYDKTRYAIADISFTKSGTPSKEVRVSKEGFDELRYLLESGNVLKGDFTMGGYNYRNGYRLKTGYGWNEKDESKLGLNLRGQYSTLSFDIARIPRDNSYEHYLRSATLTIEVDGAAVYSEVPILWNDLVHPITLNVSGARQVLIKVKSSGYDILGWGVGNIQFS